MAIKGVTDRPVIRRDGKIRGGFKDNNNNPVNTDHFVLVDSPQLIPTLGEKPVEIYFTVPFDDYNAIAPSDLRMYTKTELVCNGDGEHAAYMGTGEVPGVSQQQGSLNGRPVPRSRARLCQYKQCPDYVAGNCSEFIRLGMMIPQYSMGSWFDFENTSINALLNIIGAFDKCKLSNIHRGGKVSGEIFRLYKEKQSLPFENAKTGKRGRSDKDVVHMSHVPFHEYEAKFKEKCPPESWQALLAIRQMSVVVPTSAFQLEGPSPQAQLSGPQSIATHAAMVADPEAELAAVKERANHPGAAKVFEEISKLAGKENSEATRIATAKAFPDVGRMVDYLGKKITEYKKAAAASAAPAVQAAQATPVAALPPETVLPAAGEAVRAPGLL